MRIGTLLVGMVLGVIVLDIALIFDVVNVDMLPGRHHKIEATTPVLPQDDEPLVLVSKDESLPDAGYRSVTAKVTAYCPCSRCCGAFSDGKTATMTDASTPGAAVAWGAIPRKSSLYVPGYGWTVADDTGGAMRQSWKRGIIHIDLRFSTHQEALNWGVQELSVLIPE